MSSKSVVWYCKRQHIFRACTCFGPIIKQTLSRSRNLITQELNSLPRTNPWSMCVSRMAYAQVAMTHQLHDVTDIHVTIFAQRGIFIRRFLLTHLVPGRCALGQFRTVVQFRRVKQKNIQRVCVCNIYDSYVCLLRPRKTGKNQNQFSHQWMSR